MACDWESSSKVGETLVKYSVSRTAGKEFAIGNWNCCELYKDDWITNGEILAAAVEAEPAPENDVCSEDVDPNLQCDLKVFFGAGSIGELKYCDILSLGRAVWGCTLVVGEALSEVFWFVGCLYEADSNGNDRPKIKSKQNWSACTFDAQPGYEYKKR